MAVRQNGLLDALAVHNPRGVQQGELAAQQLGQALAERSGMYFGVGYAQTADHLHHMSTPHILWPQSSHQRAERIAP